MCCRISFQVYSYKVTLFCQSLSFPKHLFTWFRKLTTIRSAWQISTVTNFQNLALQLFHCFDRRIEIDVRKHRKKLKYFSKQVVETQGQYLVSSNMTSVASPCIQIQTSQLRTTFMPASVACSIAIYIFSSLSASIVLLLSDVPKDASVNRSHGLHKRSFLIWECWRNPLTVHTIVQDACMNKACDQYSIFYFVALGSLKRCTCR